MHGGLSPELTSMDQISNISRPCDVPDTGLLCDLLWSDPDPSLLVSTCSVGLVLVSGMFHAITWNALCCVALFLYICIHLFISHDANMTTILFILFRFEFERDTMQMTEVFHSHSDKIL